ncbi:DNA polymerase II [Candidatus Woesearchaeota archaeon]|nr:DNA polymerase II [Candidatus Woesearchaeota archaeon]
MVLGFITNSHYTTENNITIVHLFGRLENQKSFEIQVPYTPYFFIRKEDKKLIKAEITAEETTLTTMQKEPVLKINTLSPKEVPELRSLFEKSDVPCFEADIQFTRRFLMDKGILALLDIKGEELKGKYTDILFVNPEINPVSKTPEIVKKCSPKMIAFDIETDAKANIIYSISFATDKEEFAGILKNDSVSKFEKEFDKNITLFSEEQDLISWFFKIIREYDPDIITGWHVIDFDLKVILERAKFYKLSFNIGRDDRNSSLRIESSFFRDSSANAYGRVILDGIQLLKSSFIKLDDYKLNTAAKHFLNDSKLIEEDKRFEIIDEMYTNNPKQFIAYNIKDSRLTYDIIIKSGVYDLTMQRSLLTGLHMDSVKASIASFDSLYLRELRKKGVVAPSTRPTNSEEGIGGYVRSSKPGIYDNVLVLDFKSLYPSLMRTFNIDPYSYVGEKQYLEQEIDVNDKDQYIIAPNDAVFRNEEGIMPSMLKTLWDERDVARRQGNELARYAIKILMNSMYGVLASPNSRYHIRNLSNSITSFGQYFIKLTASRLEEQGYDVIYGDTDSVFVDVKTKDLLEADNIGKSIEKDLNKFIQKHIEEKYNTNSVLELEYEKLFKKFFMPKARGTEVGAKKRYAGLKVTGLGTESQKEQLDFTGLEFVRRDWTELAKEFQLKLLDLIFSDAKDEAIENFVSNFVDDIKSGKLDELLVYRKSLRKDVESYTKTTPPHVKAARMLDKIEGSIIEYVITLEGPQPIQKILAPLDYDHYIEKQIKPIADSVLGLLDSSFEDVMKGSKQSGLDSFF